MFFLKIIHNYFENFTLDNYKDVEMKNKDDELKILIQLMGLNPIYF